MSATTTSAFLRRSATTMANSSPILATTSIFLGLSSRHECATARTLLATGAPAGTSGRSWRYFLPFLIFSDSISFKSYGAVGNVWVDRFPNFGLPGQDYWYWQIGLIASVSVSISPWPTPTPASTPWAVVTPLIARAESYERYQIVLAGQARITALGRPHASLRLSTRKSKCVGETADRREVMGHLQRRFRNSRDMKGAPLFTVFASRSHSGWLSLAGLPTHKTWHMPPVSVGCARKRLPGRAIQTASREAYSAPSASCFQEIDLFLDDLNSSILAAARLVVVQLFILALGPPSQIIEQATSLI